MKLFMRLTQFGRDISVFHRAVGMSDNLWGHVNLGEAEGQDEHDQVFSDLDVDPITDRFPRSIF